MAKKPVHFSNYLKVSVALLVTGSVIIISVALSLYFSQRLESEFEKKVQAQKGQAESILNSRLSDIEQSVLALSTDNSLRATMMMGDATQLAARMDEFNADTTGLFYFIQKEGQDQIFPSKYPDWVVKILASDLTEPIKGLVNQTNGQTRLIWRFEAPILREEERMGEAIALYDMIHDTQLMNSSNRIIRNDIYFLKPNALMGLIGDNSIPLDPTSLRAIARSSRSVDVDQGLVIVSLHGFKNLYFLASRKELVTQKRNVALVIIVFTISVLAISILFTILLSKRLTRPLDELVHKAHHISSGLSGANFKIDSPEYMEFQRLSQVFDDMLDKLKAAEEKNRFTELMKNVDDAVYIVDSEGKIIQASDSTSLQLGYDMDTLLNLKHDNLLPENDVRIIHDLLDRNWSANHYSDVPTKTTIESYHITKDGNQVPVEIRSRAIIYQNKQAILNVARDISNRKAAEHEKKQLETQLLHAQKMEAIGTLAGGVAHDFNNLLQVIHGYTELLITLKNSDDPELNQLEEIRNAAQRASELTDQLLTFSRKTESSAQPIELNDEIIQSCRLLKSTIPSDIVLDSRLADDLMMINADPGQIQQVVMNLGFNARDAMPEGGQLIIETKNISIDEIDCKTCLEATPGKYVCLSVSDNGNGMDSETIKHIFEPFFTTKDTGKGTGLGLAIVYGIVKNAGGFLNCYSEIGLGTTIRAYFPAIQSSTALMQPINSPYFSESPQVLLDERSSVIDDQKWRGSETILLVDDEEQIRDLIVTALPQYGYTVLDAANGVEALSVYKARREEIDLVILDMIMPEMDGKKCFQKLKELDPAISVIMSSGYSVSGSYRDLGSGGVKAFIDKPYRFGQMLETIRKILDEEENHGG